jgi:serine/threonine-protein kinase
VPDVDRVTSDSSGERACPACGSRYSGATRFCPSDGQPLRDPGESSDALIGSLVADRYYVERRLGLGGMGVVYLAQHVYMSRPCALKVLRGEYLARTDALARFTRGAQNASRILHRNVAAIHDFGEIAGESMYLAMEYVDGLTLGAVIDREGPLPLARCVTILSQVASALRAAHDLGIVHRDLKPDNIMLAQSAEGDDLVKVVDFGIARALFDDDQRVTQSDAMVGTPAYMSPEQLRGRPVDTRSDLYSLGLVTIAMLTGALPLSSDPVDLALRFMQRPRTLRELRPSIEWPSQLQAVLDQALAPDPDDRQGGVTQFAKEFIDAVRDWRPAEVAAATAALSRLGVDMSLALSPETIVRIGTPTEARTIPAVAPITNSAPLDAGVGAARTGRTPGRKLAMFGGGVAAALAIATAVFVASRGRTVAPSIDAQVVSRNAPPVASAAQGAEFALPATSGRDTVGGSGPGASLAADEAREVPDSSRRVNALRRGGTGLGARGTSPDPPTAARVDDSSRVAPDTRPAPGLGDSSSAGRAIETAIPNLGMIRIGSAGSIGAALYVNDRLVGVVSTLRTISIAPGAVHLRLSIERCQDWDSTITVARGDTVSIGYRRPLCPP